MLIDPMSYEAPIFYLVQTLSSEFNEASVGGEVGTESSKQIFPGDPMHNGLPVSDSPHALA